MFYHILPVLSFQTDVVAVLLIIVAVVIALFDDQEDSWPAATSSSCDCACALSKARISVPLIKGNNADVGGDHPIYEHIRPRFWYATLISCATPVTADYTITFERNNGSQVSDSCSALFPTYEWFNWLPNPNLRPFAGC